MTKIYSKIFYKDAVVDSDSAKIHIASSAVLYGLSVYTVFPINKIGENYFVFRIDEHIKRMANSAKLIGIDLPDTCEAENFQKIITQLVAENKPEENVFARVTIHVDELLPGTKSRGVSTCLSVFLYEANPIVPQDGVKLKISPWRRNPDFCIPSRAKINGAYVNSVLAKQDAIDSGYDDAIFLDLNGHVCELSAANIFIVREGVLITPDNSADILEGINRKTILEIAKLEGIKIEERKIDMTELYIADEIFATGTSAFVAPVINVDGRTVGSGQAGEITKILKERTLKIQNNQDELSKKYLMKINFSI